MILEPFYHSEKVNEHIDAIRSRTGEIMYLIKGTKRAVIIDTCLGIGNIREEAEKLTHLLIFAILTHGHVDHAMGAQLFEEVYFNHKDDAVYEAHSPLAERQGYTEAGLGMEFGSLSDAAYVPVTSSEKYKDLSDGDVFNLGGIHVETYSLAGHTPGTMVVLIPEERILITGDAANNSLFLFDTFSLSVETYRRNLEQLLSRIKGRYDSCFMMHHDMKASGQLLEHMIEVCDDIINGNTDDMPFDFMGEQYFIAKNIKPGFQRLDGKEGNIVYNKNKVLDR